MSLVPRLTDGLAPRTKPTDDDGDDTVVREVPTRLSLVASGVGGAATVSTGISFSDVSELWTVFVSSLAPLVLLLTFSLTTFSVLLAF